MPITKEIKRRAIELLMEQGSENLLRNNAYIITTPDGTKQFCAGGAIAIAAGVADDKFLSVGLIRSTSGISSYNLTNLIHINDTGSFEELIEAMEALPTR